LLIAASLANIFLQIPALSVTVSAVAVLIFSLTCSTTSPTSSGRRNELRDGHANCS
jgi:hypothetical protein